MAMKPCRECGEKISDQSKTCPHCGIMTSRAEAVGEKMQTVGCALTILITIPFLLFMCFAAG